MSLRIEARLQTTPGTAEVRVVSDGQELSLSVEKAKARVIELVRSQLSLKNISFQVLRANLEEQDLLGAKTADEWIDKYMSTGQKQ